jgi:hypothetical protein
MDKHLNDCPEIDDKDFEKIEMAYRRGFHQGVVSVLYGLNVLNRLYPIRNIIIIDLISYMNKIFLWRRFNFKKPIKKNILKDFHPKWFEDFVKEIHPKIAKKIEEEEV